MTNFEAKLLRQSLLKELSSYQSHTDFLRETDRPLDEDSGQLFLTTAEQQVFQITPAYFHALRLAYSGYEMLIDICEGVLPENIEKLIIEARKICPPATYGKHEIPFKTGIDDKQWFIWFASKFLEIPQRQSYAYHAKRSFNLFHLTTFDDERYTDPETGEPDDIPF